MKASDICKQLAANIPKFTDGFSESVGVVSIVPSGSTATATTDSAHGLVDGGLATITGATAPVQIDTASFLRTTSQAQFETLQEHN